MMIDKERIKEFKEQGFIIVKDFFDRTDIARIFNDIKEVFAFQIEQVLNIPVKESMALSDEAFSAQLYELNHRDFELFSNCGKQAQHLISLHELGVSKKLIGLLNELGLSKPIISVRPSILINHKKLDKEGEKGTYWRIPPHQDWYYSQGSLDSVTVWFPFVICPKELGSLEFIPGSHLWGLQKSDEKQYGLMSEYLPDDKYVTFDTGPGDVLIFFSTLIHRGGINSTNRIRWSGQLRYNNLCEPTFVQRKFPNPFVYHSIRTLVTPGFPNDEDLKKAIL